MTARVSWERASLGLKALIIRLACDADDSTILAPGGWRYGLTVKQALEVLK